MTNAERQKRHRNKMKVGRAEFREQVKARPPELAFRRALWRFVENYRSISPMSAGEASNAMERLGQYYRLAEYLKSGSHNPKAGEESSAERDLNCLDGFLNPRKPTDKDDYVCDGLHAEKEGNPC